MLDVLIFLAVLLLCLMLLPWIGMLVLGIIAVLLSLYEVLRKELRDIWKRK